MDYKSADLLDITENNILHMIPYDIIQDEKKTNNLVLLSIDYHNIAFEFLQYIEEDNKVNIIKLSKKELLESNYKLCHIKNVFSKESYFINIK